MKQIIKVRFLKEGIAIGKAYTYFSLVSVNLGDTVQITSAAKGIVVEVDVPEEEIAAYRDKVKCIVGLVEQTLDDLDLSTRTYNVLKRHGIRTVAELRSMTYDELCSVRNMGQKCIDEIKERLGGI